MTEFLEERKGTLVRCGTGTRFHVSLWASVSKPSCNYSPENISLSWNPSFSGRSIEDVLLAIVIFHLYPMKVVFIKEILVYHHQLHTMAFVLLDLILLSM